MLITNLGLAALGASWAVGVAGYALLANWDFVPAPARAAIGLRNPGGPVNALDLIGILLCIVVWQMTVFFLLDGYPVSKIKNTAAYLVVTVGRCVRAQLHRCRGHRPFGRLAPLAGTSRRLSPAHELLAVATRCSRASDRFPAARA